MIQKQNININFAQGTDTKTDPWQISPNNFLELKNMTFGTPGRLTKRPGNDELTTLPAAATCLTTFNGDLTAIGNSIYGYNSGASSWVTKGVIQPLELSVLPLIRNNINQVQCDTAIASNGLVCTVYSETNNGTTDYRYAIADSVTGQNIIAPSAIPVTSGTVTGSPRVFVLGNLFVIVFTNVITATSHLQYVAISVIDPTLVTANADIASSYISSTTLSWDGVVVGTQLFIAYNTTTGGQAVKMTYLTATSAAMAGAPVAAVTFAGLKATLMTVCSDTSNPVYPIVYVNIYRSDTSVGKIFAVDQNLNTILAATTTIPSGTVLNLASSAQNAVCTLFYEVSNAYSYDGAIASNYIAKYTITQAGTVSSSSNVIRSVGLASKAFIVDGVIYFLAAYSSLYQPTYFLINGSTSLEASPVIAAKLAYENGGGYLVLGLPSVTVVDDNICYVGYLFKDLIAAVNKGTAVSGTQTAGIYSQTGINLGKFIIGTENIDKAEIGNDLLISGGFLWMYDGYLPVENNFFLWPDSVEATWSATGGSIHAQPDGSTNTNAYYYQVTYEWSDNQGNIYRSAPSIPVPVTTTSNGTSGSITVKVPTLRLTYKTANPVKIVVYRWSVAQQVYYQTTSLTAPQLNSTTADSISFVDTNADATILGNNIIYTNGGVLENVSGPASNLMTLFDTRLWLLDAEDPNLLWFSKQVIENTPVEMSDLLTYYVSPTQSAQGSTGPITAMAPMDDKLVVYKNNAIYYTNGSGPDNTGANSQYSQPIFITSTVGCSNQRSIVLIPDGLMFQSQKGIWILKRDLSTFYIGAPVEAFNASTVTSAVSVPKSNQVQFTLDTGETLMYDYFVGQWSWFTGNPAISSCIFEDLPTTLNSYSEVFQENPDSGLDGLSPVLLKLKTAWLNLAGLQGYQRAYFFYLLGRYLTPHKLMVSIAYDYESAPSESVLISPDNFSPALGGTTVLSASGTNAQDPLGQGTPYGGASNIENWRVFLSRQRCQAIQITIEEIYDPSFGVTAGAGLTLSGINLVYGVKQRFRPQPAATSAGTA